MQSDQEFAQAVRMAEQFSSLSPAARRVVSLLSSLPFRLVDREVRDEVRAFLSVCLECGVDPVAVERGRVVLAAFEGVVGGEESEGVRLVG